MNKTDSLFCNMYFHAEQTEMGSCVGLREDMTLQPMLSEGWATHRQPTQNRWVYILARYK
jgi:hypothetical protein